VKSRVRAFAPSGRQTARPRVGSNPQKAYDIGNERSDAGIGIRGQRFDERPHFVRVAALQARDSVPVSVVIRHVARRFGQRRAEERLDVGLHGIVGHRSSMAPAATSAPPELRAANGGGWTPSAPKTPKSTRIVLVPPIGSRDTLEE